MVLVAQDHKQVTYAVPEQVCADVFRTYDIRGPVADDAINVPLAYALGLVFGSQVLALGDQQVIVGRDGRLTSPELSQACLLYTSDAADE